MALQFYGGSDLKSASSGLHGSFSSYGGCCDTGVDAATLLALIAGMYRLRNLDIAIFLVYF